MAQDLEHLDKGASCARWRERHDSVIREERCNGFSLHGPGDLREIVQMNQSPVTLHVFMNVPSYGTQVEILNIILGKSTKRLGQYRLT